MLVTFLIALAFMCLGILAGTLAWVLAHFVKKSPEGKINVREGGFVVKAVFVMAVGGGGLLGLAIVGFFVSAVWWVLSIMNLTPGRLALLSLLIGVFPMILAFLGTALAKVSGGHVDASGVRDCFLFGFNLNNLVYTLFMCHWAVIFTGGLAVFGLMASGLWALLT
jgi:hypothetical protein